MVIVYTYRYLKTIIYTNYIHIIVLFEYVCLPMQASIDPEVPRVKKFITKLNRLQWNPRNYIKEINYLDTIVICRQTG